MAGKVLFIVGMAFIAWINNRDFILPDMTPEPVATSDLIRGIALMVSGIGLNLLWPPKGVKEAGQ